MELNVKSFDNILVNFAIEICIIKNYFQNLSVRFVKQYGII